jgi:hypothetical protein
MKFRLANNCVQATPDCACLFFVAHVFGAHDAECSMKTAFLWVTLLPR